MALTPEEKKKRAEERTRRRREQEQKYPPAELRFFNDNDGIKVLLNTDMPNYLTVLRKGDWYSTNFETWKQMSVPIDNIVELGEFIHALICRYNMMVNNANQNASHSMKLLEPIVNIQDNDNLAS